MNMYLLVAFLLLIAMLFLILRPFLLGTAEPAVGVPVDAGDPGAKARSMAKVERVARAPEAAVATSVMTAPVLTSDDRHPDVIDQPAAVVDAEPAPAPTSSDDVRAQVEAAIAARKAALQAKPCTGCGTKVEPGDAFCRSCGTKVTA